MRLDRGVFDARSIFDAEHAKVDAVNAKPIKSVGLLCQSFASINAVFGISNKRRDVAATDREALGIEYRRAR